MQAAWLGDVGELGDGELGDSLDLRDFLDLQER